MITHTIKTTGGKIKITIPSDRTEISIGMLERLTPAPGDMLSPLEQLSVLSGIPKEYNPGQPDAICLEDVVNIEDLNVFDETLQKIAYQLAAFVEVQKIPSTVRLYITGFAANKRRWKFFNPEHGKGVNVPVLSNLGIAPAGAYMEAKQTISEDMAQWQKHNPTWKETDPDMKSYSPLLSAQIKILALYLFQPATGEKFTPRAAEAFESVIKRMPITEALPIARHFFLSYPNLSKPKAPAFREALRQSRKRQA